MNFETLKWFGGIEGHLELIDQRVLPVEFMKIKCRDVNTLFDCIKTLAVRGAPAIGVAAGFGPVLALQELCDDAGLQKGVETVKKSSEYLATSRPTAVNLFWALNRIQRCGEEFVEKNPDADLNSFKKEILNCANMIFTEDVEMCKAIGVNGEKFIEHNSTVLTHCNAGALATAGQGPGWFGSRSSPGGGRPS